MFHPDFHHDIPIGNEILAEIGIDRHTVREVIDDERAIRCPDADSLHPDRTIAALDDSVRFQQALHEAALLDLLGSSRAFPPAG